MGSPGVQGATPLCHTGFLPSLKATSASLSLSPRGLYVVLAPSLLGDGGAKAQELGAQERHELAQTFLNPCHRPRASQRKRWTAASADGPPAPTMSTPELAGKRKGQLSPDSHIFYTPNDQCQVSGHRRVRAGSMGCLEGTLAPGKALVSQGVILGHPGAGLCPNRAALS